MIDRSTRLAVTGLLAIGLAVTAAAWPSRPPGAQAVAARPTATSASVQATSGGANLFLVKGCATCHDGPETSARIPVGPDLGALPAVAATRVAGLDGPAYVRQSVRTPQAFVVPGYEQLMPTLAISDEELDALVQYLLG